MLKLYQYQNGVKFTDFIRIFKKNDQSLVDAFKPALWVEELNNL